jgi:hypothetical protein
MNTFPQKVSESLADGFDHCRESCTGLESGAVSDAAGEPVAAKVNELPGVEGEMERAAQRFPSNHPGCQGLRPQGEAFV